MPARHTGSDPERGAAAVEFAIIAPLIAMMLFAVTDFGLALSRMEAFTSAAREGARFAAVRCRTQSDPEGGCSSGEIEARIAASSGGYLEADEIALDPMIACSDETIGDLVTVGWEQTLDLQVPFVNLTLYDGSVHISGSFRCEP